MAASSFNKPLIGLFARWTGTIPIYRPQDYTFTGDGKAKFNGRSIIGQGTKFTSISDKLEGGTVHLNGSEKFVVTKVVSDEELLIKEPLKKCEPTEFVSFTVIPRIDNSICFGEVYKALNEGACILVFPEGTSHDNSTMIELKAGVALFSLGAMEQGGSEPVTIVPIGLNYFDRDCFRSTVFIEYGKPLTIPNEMLEEFRVNKKEATSKLLSEVQDVLN